MDTQYLIRKIETCPACKGAKFLPNLDWQEIIRANGDWSDWDDKEEAIADWKRRIEEKWPYSDPPPEEEPCVECEGEGKIESWVPLQEAMHELAERGTADDNGPVTS